MLVIICRMQKSAQSEIIVLKIQIHYKEKTMRHILASCLVTSLVIGLSGAAIAQGGTATAPTTATTTTAKKKHCCRMKKWCHKHMHHHHKATSTGTTPAPAPAAQ
jgi:hypothetical protein